MTDLPDSSLRVLWVAPWFSTLGSLWADGLRARGHRAMVVTTPMHFDPPPRHAEDLVLEHPWRSRAGRDEFTTARKAVKAFRPHVVVTEIARDPRFLQLARTPRAPVVFTTHDAVPHDGANRVPALRALSTRYFARFGSAEVVFSAAVANQLGPRRHPVHIVGLTSDLQPAMVPTAAPPSERRDFLVVGRLSEYKNLGHVIAGYERHRASPGFRGDRLVVVGAGDPGCVVPDHVEWVNRRFDFGDLVPRLARAKASLCVYSTASQSGVQVVSMHCSTPVVVSDAGGLAEYLPPGEQALGRADVDGLASALDHLADPVVAADAGTRARATYDARYAVDVTSAEWEGVLRRVVQVADVRHLSAP